MKQVRFVYRMQSFQPDNNKMKRCQSITSLKRRKNQETITWFTAGFTVANVTGEVLGSASRGLADLWKSAWFLLSHHDDGLGSFCLCPSRRAGGGRAQCKNTFAWWNHRERKWWKKTEREGSMQADRADGSTQKKANKQKGKSKLHLHFCDQKTFRCWWQHSLFGIFSVFVLIMISGCGKGRKRMAKDSKIRPLLQWCYHRSPSDDHEQHHHPIQGKRTKPKRRRAIDTATKKVSKEKKEQPNRMKTTKGPIERNPVHTDLFRSPHLLFIFLSPQQWFNEGSQKSDDPLSPLCSLSSVCHWPLKAHSFHSLSTPLLRGRLAEVWHCSEDWAHASTPEWRQEPDERAKTRKRRREGRVRSPGECRSVESTTRQREERNGSRRKRKWEQTAKLGN